MVKKGVCQVCEKSVPLKRLYLVILVLDKVVVLMCRTCLPSDNLITFPISSVLQALANARWHDYADLHRNIQAGIGFTVANEAALKRIGDQAEQLEHLAQELA